MSARRRNRTEFLRDTDGAAAVEFAIVSVAFLMFLFVIAYMGIILFTNATLQWAVQKSSRLAAINPAVTQSEIATAVNNYLSSANAPSASVSYTVAQTGSFKTGTISASFAKQYTVPLISTFDIHYKAVTSVPLGS